jgi:hypothetical protein
LGLRSHKGCIGCARSHERRVGWILKLLLALLDLWEKYTWHLIASLIT